MRYLVVSDIHANVHALEAVLAAAPRVDWDALVVLGDLVGYGADPNAVVERIRALEPMAIVRGNHDKVACGLASGDDFNTIARIAASWTQRALTADNLAYLRALPVGPLFVGDALEICHGTPQDEDEYVFDPDDALDALESSGRPVCFFGHTHLPMIYTRSADAFDMKAISGSAVFETDLARDLRYLVNPGSVGQPRDGDPRAAFALFDADRLRVDVRRVPYPLAPAQEAILAAGLPRHLATRLAVGR
jgi:predicted phosphodiesterase